MNTNDSVTNIEEFEDRLEITYVEPFYVETPFHSIPFKEWKTYKIVYSFAEGKIEKSEKIYL